MWALPGAVRRLLQGVVSPGMIRKLQGNLPQSSIRWEFVNLIEPDPLRRVKLRITHEKLEDLHPADLADIMEDLSAAERQGIIASLDEETAASVLAELDERLTTQIVEKLDPGKGRRHSRRNGARRGRRPARRPSQGDFGGSCWTKCPARKPTKFASLLAFDPATAGGMMNHGICVCRRRATTRDEVLHWMRTRT